MGQVQLKEKVLLTLENDKRTVGCECWRTLVSQSRCNLKGHSLPTIDYRGESRRAAKGALCFSPHFQTANRDTRFRLDKVALAR